MIRQPLSEWSAANHCYVTTARAMPGAEELSNEDLPRNCDQPNVPDYTVAAWLKNPANAAAASR